MKRKLDAILDELILRRERMEIEAYDLQRTTDVRVIGPVISAYGIIITWLDRRIGELKQQLK